MNAAAVDAVHKFQDALTNVACKVVPQSLRDPGKSSIGPWSTQEIKSFYAQYASKYDQDIEHDQSSYPAPFTIGSWMVKWFEFNNALCKRVESSSIIESSSAWPVECFWGDPKTSLTHLQDVISILDVGCGTGQSSVTFFESPTIPLHVHGIDASIDMLKQARERNRPFKSLVCANIEPTLPYPTNAFHAAICVGVTDFVGNLPAFLRELSRVTRLVVGITLPEFTDSCESDQAASSQLPSRLQNDLPDADTSAGRPLNGWTRDDMDGMVQANGFTIERHERMLGYRDSNTCQIVYYHAFLLLNRKTEQVSP